MNFKQLVLLSTITVLSCNVIKTNHSVRLADGYYYYEQLSPALIIQLLGDYKFQSLKTKYFRDVENHFLKYVTIKINGTTPKILYTAHTYVQPYYSAVGLQYSNISLDTFLINSIKEQLRIKLNISLKQYKEIKLGVKNVYKLTYQVVNPANEIASSHTEYFLKNGNYVYRFLFWTINSDDKVINEEAEYIISHIKFD